MIGSEVPDLATTPCAACGESLAETPTANVRWDPFQPGDVRLAAAPYHLACAKGAGFLPPTEPAAEHGRCDRCGEPIEDLASAYRALQQRFLTAKGSLMTPSVVWRVAAREPRRYAAEHFACLLAAVERKAPPEDPPGLPGAAD